MRYPLALALVALALVARACGNRDVDKGAYISANKALFQTLPVFPGAQLREQSSSPYHAGEDGQGPIAGYTTLFEFKLPRDARAGDVARFYRRQLEPRWRLVESLGGPVLNFRKRRSSVSINLEGRRTHLLEVAVDHDG